MGFKASHCDKLIVLLPVWGSVEAQSLHFVLLKPPSCPEAGLGTGQKGQHMADQWGLLINALIFLLTALSEQKTVQEVFCLFFEDNLPAQHSPC